MFKKSLLARGTLKTNTPVAFFVFFQDKTKKPLGQPKISTEKVGSRLHGFGSFCDSLQRVQEVLFLA